MNGVKHEHICVECSKPHVCWNPECMHLPGKQLLCPRCSYLYGWKQKHERSQQDDWSAL